MGTNEGKNKIGRRAEGPIIAFSNRPFRRSYLSQMAWGPITAQWPPLLPSTRAMAAQTGAFSQHHAIDLDHSKLICNLGRIELSTLLSRSLRIPPVLPLV
ncbi:hypothetical protein CLAIMM_14162 isoform 2 [Cladophialophora immunda]|nr:hypothetical protein CLAIMM_14162 isoform 1 [Cladophialophora immunda]OQV10120.1 hypothetical protein CLAIMM_14162 isoform 2 [Cladophialophora immunda]